MIYFIMLVSKIMFESAIKFLVVWGRLGRKIEILGYRVNVIFLLLFLICFYFFDNVYLFLYGKYKKR